MYEGEGATLDSGGNTEDDDDDAAAEFGKAGNRRAIVLDLLPGRPADKVLLEGDAETRRKVLGGAGRELARLHGVPLPAGPGLTPAGIRDAGGSLIRLCAEPGGVGEREPLRRIARGARLTRDRCLHAFCHSRLHRRAQVLGGTPVPMLELPASLDFNRLLCLTLQLCRRSLIILS